MSPELIVELRLGDQGRAASLQPRAFQLVRGRL
ncbi:hypothetical protein Ae150APs1_6100 [Pseudonocardia sp. Ae150A_Ps1]|nr:hypothetical protein Ae150APs1_6100 [Pseudonocardia sp. Ae150A_Ps1]